MSLIAYLFCFFSFILRDAKLFNIAVDAEKKNQLELELQVLSSSLQYFGSFATFCLFIELFCFIVTVVLFLLRVTDKIQLLMNFTGHQSANTTKIRRVQESE